MLTISKKPQDKFSPIEITFHRTSKKKLAWFYQLLVAEYVNDPKKVKDVAKILKPWKLDHDLERLREINTCLFGHPLLLMAFNVMLNSDVTFISLEVSVNKDEEIKILKNFGEFRQNNKYNMEIDEETLMQQFLTKEVEMKAINDGLYPEVLYAMSVYQNKHSPYAFKTKGFRTFCQKLVTFYGYSKHWNKLMDSMDKYPLALQIGTKQYEEVKIISARKELLKTLCNMLKDRKNFDLLLELKHHVIYIGDFVHDVKMLAPHPYKGHQQQQQQ